MQQSYLLFSAATKTPTPNPTVRFNKCNSLRTRTCFYSTGYVLGMYFSQDIIITSLLATETLLPGDNKDPKIRSGGQNVAITIVDNESDRDLVF